MTVSAATGTSPDAADERVSFVAPLLGLGGALDFTLRALDDLGTVFALRSVDEGASTRLFLVHAAAHVRGYEPPVAVGLALLGVDGVPASDDDIATLVVLNPEGDGGAATVNLLAPVLVNTRTHRAVQIVLDGDWPLRAPLAPSPDREIT
ncbi:flagellar assembly protein FliW [Sanguibacter massiliensis]|uniref:flagellar assembly protein FliW n=1 Tax=Sanguibacter massiliensis TaxID=1973217 RepID=UPI000C84E394|nr:flagellar assembly protein FliW [Sanguibacter massiliensis]